MIIFDIIKNILPVIIKKLGIDRDFKAKSVIWHWADIAGSEIAKHSNPVLIQQGVIIIIVKNSVWSHHLCMLKKNLLNKINIYIGEKLITDIKFKVGNIKEYQDVNTTNSDQRNTLLPLDNIESHYAKELVNNICDKQLKNKILKVLIKDLSRKKFYKQENWQPCKKCGILIEPAQYFCTVCEFEERRSNLENIRKYLLEVPWLPYGEFLNYYNCSKGEFFRAKTELLNTLLQEMYTGTKDHIREITLVMLLTGVPPFGITSELISNTIQKIRGKKYVFASKS